MRVAIFAVLAACSSPGPDMLDVDAAVAPDSIVGPDARAVVDLDDDGLDDALEQQLAMTYVPYLSLDPDDGCPLSGLVARVRKHPADPSKVLIVYSHLFGDAAAARRRAGGARSRQGQERAGRERARARRRVRLRRGASVAAARRGNDAARLARAPVGQAQARRPDRGRLELGRRSLVSVEGSLWLVDGAHGQGSVLGTLAYRVGRRFELRTGGGLRITGDALGPALTLVLRTQLVGRFSAYLRYDGALLLHDQTYDGQNAGSLGFEASF
jgi:hypothetical protein